MPAGAVLRVGWDRGLDFFFANEMHVLNYDVCVRFLGLWGLLERDLLRA